MKRLWLLGCASLLLIAASPPPTAEEIGPQPDFAQAVAITEQALRGRLIDPGSAQIEWPYDFTGGSLKPFLSKRMNGWFTCGLVNARNRMGGYTGRAFFQVLFRDGQLQMLDIGDSSDLDLVGASCTSSINKGLFRPAPPMPTAGAITGASPTARQAEPAAAPAITDGGHGISFMASPIGAVVVAVAKGSLADTSNLKAGSTIEAVNGAVIKGLDAAAVSAILRAQPVPIALKLLGGGEIVLGAPAPRPAAQARAVPARAAGSAAGAGAAPARTGGVRCITCR